MNATRYSRLFGMFFLAGALGAVSCGKKEKVSKRVSVVDPVLKENRSSEQAGGVHRTQDRSAIHWQTWSDGTMKRAKDADRLLLVVTVLPQQSGFREILRRIEHDEHLVREINANYVPILVDGDSAREMGLLAGPLCSEIKQPLDLPIFIWMTSERNPVAWMPISGNRMDEVTRIFGQSHQMVSRMWRDDPSYVLKNSAADNASRRSRMLEEGREVKASLDPANDVAAGARQLISLYDPFSRTIDESGGLFPSGVLDVTTAAAALPGRPGGLPTTGLQMTEDLLEDLLTSAMFDPLEGGVFSGRIAQSWMLPGFTWNCGDQGRIAALLFRAHQITGDATALERALGLLKFAESRFLNGDGLFGFGPIGSAQPAAWLWTTEEIEKALPPEDAKWWIAATGMNPLGNLPSEADPGRVFFRKNSLALSKPLSAAAAKFSVPAADFQARFETSRKKLLEIRTGKLGPVIKDAIPHAGANFRMISAYSAAYAATGDAAWREKALTLLDRSKKAFFADGKLQSFGAGGAGNVDARAFIYALAVQASLDVADITSDDSLLGWVEELCSIVEKRFKTDDGLMEVSADAEMIDLPIVDRRRIFDDTTGGLFALTAVRLAPTGHPAADVAARLAAPLPENATRVPILHTDGIFAALVKHRGKSVVRGNALSPEMKEAVERLPYQLVPRAGAKVSDGIPDGSVRVISPDGSMKLISNLSDLRKELLLSDRKP